MSYTTIDTFTQTNLGWAAALAATMFAMTRFSLGLLNARRREDIALWLMGAQSGESWARSFVSLFDALFGQRHLSLTCILRSCLASLVAVTLIWLMMGSAETLAVRAQADLSLGQVLLIALAVNLAADYASLLETRFLLGRMPRGTLAQAGVLVVDLIVSGAIIWAAIWAYLHSPLYVGTAESFAEIVGLFSVFSVFFYSTFLTSVWTWGYILSTWLMRMARRLRLADWLDVEERPVLIMSVLLAVCVFLGSLAVAVPLQKGADGLTVADRALCRQFGGPVCLDVAGLASEAEATWALMRVACNEGLISGTYSSQCRAKLFDFYLLDEARVRKIVGLSCADGDALACGMVMSLGIDPGMCANVRDAADGNACLQALLDTALENRRVPVESGTLPPGPPDGDAPERSPSIDLETMKLKRGIDLGSQMRDMRDQVDEQRPTAPEN